MNSPPVLLRHATLFDSVRGTLQPHTNVLVQGARIAAVTTEPISPEGKHVIDVAGRVMLPGLIDAHVHITAASQDLMSQALQAPSLVVAHSAQILSAMLMRGFTSVRDAGGADFGLQEAVAKGLFAGPRLFIAGFPLSQTGGHADMRPRSVRSTNYFCTCAGLGLIGAICDGVGEVRRQAREQIRTGANQIKIMAGGGVSSPSDPLEGTQFSMDELRAACEEADAANIYAMAHAYAPRAITRAVQAGVRSIEHGNLLDEPTARVMKEHGAYLVPTLSTYASAANSVADGTAVGWSPEMIAKLNKVQHAGITAMQIAKAHGVPIAFGTDLLGPPHAQQCGEFALRAPVMTPIEQLQSATSIPARMMGQSAHIGNITAGAFADLMVMDADPTQDIGVMAAASEHMVLLMQGGRMVKNQLP